MDKGGMHADTWTRFFFQILLLGAHNRAVLQTAATDAAVDYPQHMQLIHAKHCGFCCCPKHALADFESECNEYRRGAALPQRKKKVAAEWSRSSLRFDRVSKYSGQLFACVRGAPSRCTQSQRSAPESLVGPRYRKTGTNGHRSNDFESLVQIHLSNGQSIADTCARNSCLHHHPHPCPNPNQVEVARPARVRPQRMGAARPARPAKVRPQRMGAARTTRVGKKKRWRCRGRRSRAARGSGHTKRRLQHCMKRACSKRRGNRWSASRCGASSGWWSLRWRLSGRASPSSVPSC